MDLSVTSNFHIDNKPFRRKMWVKVVESGKNLGQK
jgi:hypothetical protein